MTHSLLLIALVVLGFWILLSLDGRRAWPRELVLPEGGTDAGGLGGVVTVVVPARNEADSLPATLPRLLDQQWPGLEVVLVDDHSDDATIETAEAIGRQHRTPLLVTRADPRPEGWAGKVHALDCGIRAALERRPETEWLLLTDADIEHRRGSVAALVTQAHAGPYDAVSVMARLHARGFWERLLIPPFVYFFQLLYPFRLVRRPESSVAAAAGGCVLVRRKSLNDAGGVAAIRSAIIDDVSLAKALKGSGARLWLGFDPGIVSTRPYRELAELWDMVARTAFVELRYRWSLVLLAVAGLWFFFTLPAVLTVVAAGHLLFDPVKPPAPWPVILAAAGTTWLLQTAALWPAVRHHQVPAAFAFTLPVAAFFYALMTLSSAWRHARGRGQRWRGRKV